MPYLGELIFSPFFTGRRAEVSGFEVLENILEIYWQTNLDFGLYVEESVNVQNVPPKLLVLRFTHDICQRW